MKSLIMRSLFIPTTALLLSPFDADAFMGQTYDGELDTVIAVPPEGDYRARFGEIDSEKSFRSFTSKKNDKDYVMFTPTFVLEDDPRLAEVKAARGSDVISVTHAGVFMDLTDAGGLDFSKGKNVDIGRMREAVGQNATSGWTFKMLEGAGPVMVHVKHETDKNDDTKKYARVSRVVKIS